MNLTLDQLALRARMSRRLKHLPGDSLDDPALRMSTYLGLGGCAEIFQPLDADAVRIEKLRRRHTAARTS